MSDHDPFAPPALVGAVAQQRPDDVEDGDTRTVPDGTVPEVLAWVNDAPNDDDDTTYDRASQALYAEGQRSKPRASLVNALEELLTEPEDGQDAEPDL